MESPSRWAAAAIVSWAAATGTNAAPAASGRAADPKPAAGSGFEWRYPQSVSWQYQVAWDVGRNKQGKEEPRYAMVWLPPGCETVRGVFLPAGVFQYDPAVRKACAAAGLAMVRIDGPLGTFRYWEKDSPVADLLVKALNAVAAATGHPEIRRVPLITSGHSTGGITCRNIAYWRPDRVASVVHFKSGNFHQKTSLPPGASLAGVPLVAINGQLETYGPDLAAIEQPMKKPSANGVPLDERYGRETQWIYVRKDIRAFRQQDPNHLMSIMVQPGDDHFFSAPEVGEYVGLFLLKTAEYRLPRALPPGDDVVKPLPVRPEDGWLSDADLDKPAFAAAPYADYRGNKAEAMWHFDGDMARATERMHRNLGSHQVLQNPTGEWLDDGDGWTFRVRTEWLTTGPESFGGRIGNQPVGHSDTPYELRVETGAPAQRVGPDTFRPLRIPRGSKAGFRLCAYHPGDATYRATYRWGNLEIPPLKGTNQTITFPPVGDVPAAARDIELKASASSGLPVYYEVDYGPVTVQDGRLRVSELPANPQFPMECRVSAYQLGRRTGAAVNPAGPASAVFRVTKP